MLRTLFLFTGHILILSAVIKRSRGEGNQLRCYKCGQQGFPSCKYFNGSDVFIINCPDNHKSCLKGWVNRSGGDNDKQKQHEKENHLTYSTILSCAPIAENICLKQNAGYIRN